MPLPTGLYDSQRYTGYGSPTFHHVPTFPTPADVLLTGWGREVHPHYVQNLQRLSPVMPEGDDPSELQYLGCSPLREEIHQSQDATPVRRRRKENASLMVTLPTGETMKANQVSKRSRFDDFPAITTPLPANVQNEEVITDWPNHLWGPLLLRIAAKYSPKEITDLLKVNIQPNTMIKRIIAAKKQAGVEVKKDARDRQKGGRKRKRTTKDGEENEAENEAEEAGKRVRVELPPESEAARAYRLQQEELQIAFEDQNPAFVEKYFNKKGKNRNGKLERKLVNAMLLRREREEGRVVELD